MCLLSHSRDFCSVRHEPWALADEQGLDAIAEGRSEGLAQLSLFAQLECAKYQTQILCRLRHEVEHSHILQIARVHKYSKPREVRHYLFNQFQPFPHQRIISKNPSPCYVAARTSDRTDQSDSDGV